VRAGALAAQQIVGDFLQRHQDRRPDQAVRTTARRRRAPAMIRIFTEIEDAETGFSGSTKPNIIACKSAPGDAGQPRRSALKAYSLVRLGGVRRAIGGAAPFGIADWRADKIPIRLLVHPPGDSQRQGPRNGQETDNNKAAPR